MTALTGDSIVDFMNDAAPKAAHPRLYCPCEDCSARNRAEREERLRAEADARRDMERDASEERLASAVAELEPVLWARKAIRKAMPGSVARIAARYGNAS